MQVPGKKEIVEGAVTYYVTSYQGLNSSRLFAAPIYKLDESYEFSNKWQIFSHKSGEYLNVEDSSHALSLFILET